MVGTDNTLTEQGKIAADLVAILCCPETKQEVSLLDPGPVDQLNQRIAKGEMKTRDGRTVVEKIDGGLLRKDKTVVYPIRDQIPIMLIEEGIILEETDLLPA